MDDLIINFAPTGIVPTKEMTPFVPITPDEIIEQVHEAYEIGITMVHVHARTDDGGSEYKSSVYAKIIGGIQKHCHDLIIVVSLSGRRYSEFEKRSEVLDLRPDMGSLTLSSMNFSREPNINAPDMIMMLARKMKKLGVVPEFECFDSGMINYSKYLINKEIVSPPYYYNFLVGGLFTAQADMSHVGIMVRDLPDDSYWSLAGLGAEQLKANMFGVAAGGGVRVGLEDNIWYDKNRTKLATNKELLLRIHELASVVERKVMSPREFGNMGFYNRDRIRP
jgi:3-keto-5-aminohexanoate cleavage enzyme